MFPFTRLAFLHRNGHLAHQAAAFSSLERCDARRVLPAGFEREFYPRPLVAPSTSDAHDATTHAARMLNSDLIVCGRKEAAHEDERKDRRASFVMHARSDFHLRL
jgi:hypothetical protein